jgi:hypothetical protein
MPLRGFRPNVHALADAWGETHARGRKVPNRSPGRDGWGETPAGDAAIASLAARQHGVVTTRQLAAAGIGERGVAQRVANGRLARIFRGVYRVGPVTAPHGLEMAAVLATGGVLSHHSAAALWASGHPMTASHT